MPYIYIMHNLYTTFIKTQCYEVSDWYLASYINVNKDVYQEHL